LPAPSPPSTSSSVSIPVDGRSMDIRSFPAGDARRLVSFYLMAVTKAEPFW